MSIRSDLPQYVWHSNAQLTSLAVEVTYQSMKIALETFKVRVSILNLCLFWAPFMGVPYIFRKINTNNL